MHGFKKQFVDNINVSDFLAEMFSYLSSVIACCGPDCQWKIHHVTHIIQLQKAMYVNQTVSFLSFSAYILKVKKMAESIHEPEKIGGKSA